jgi:hypothetical protein
MPELRNKFSKSENRGFTNHKVCDIILSEAEE